MSHTPRHSFDIITKSGDTLEGSPVEESPYRLGGATRSFMGREPTLAERLEGQFDRDPGGGLVEGPATRALAPEGGAIDFIDNDSGNIRPTLTTGASNAVSDVSGAVTGALGGAKTWLLGGLVALVVLLAAFVAGVFTG